MQCLCAFIAFEYIHVLEPIQCVLQCGGGTFEFEVTLIIFGLMEYIGLLQVRNYNSDYVLTYDSHVSNNKRALQVQFARIHRRFNLFTFSLLVLIDAV